MPISLLHMMFVGLLGFYCISDFIGYLIPNQFYTKTDLFQVIKFSIGAV